MWIFFPFFFLAALFAPHPAPDPIDTKTLAHDIVVLMIASTPDLNTTVFNDGNTPQLKKVSYTQDGIAHQEVVFKNESDATTTINSFTMKSLIERPEYQKLLLTP